MAIRRGQACLAAAAANVFIDGATVPLAKFIADGPLFGRCLGGQGDSPGAAAAAPSAAVDLERWGAAGDLLLTQVLGKAPAEAHRLTQSEAVRVYQYYLPVYFWIQGLLDARASAKTAAAAKPLTVGLSCPQGGGKTTIVDALHALFLARGQRCAEMSLDDFYLPHAAQGALAASSNGNPLLELRGNPGSHDLPLATATLNALQSGADRVLVPRYDKSAFSGRGDRRPKDEWTVAKGPVDVVLFEGWCLGFSALPDTALHDPRLLPINERLATDYLKLHQAMDAWVVVEVASPTSVYAWREEAEANMRAAGKPAMTPAQVKDFVDRYMPAYAHYLETLYARGPAGAQSSTPVLSFQIDHGRNPVAAADATPFFVQ